jgi:hypothetical protein
VKQIWKKNLYIYGVYALFSWGVTIFFMITTVWFKSNLVLTYAVSALKLL